MVGCWIIPIQVHANSQTCRWLISHPTASTNPSIIGSRPFGVDPMIRSCRLIGGCNNQLVGANGGKDEDTTTLLRIRGPARSQWQSILPPNTTIKCSRLFSSSQTNQERNKWQKKWETNNNQPKNGEGDLHICLRVLCFLVSTMIFNI
jgi:hypothetical protein